MKSEKGQILVEYAIVIPIFLLLLFAIIEIGWVGYQKVVLDYTFRKASWEFNIPANDAKAALAGGYIDYQGWVAEEMIKKQIQTSDKRVLGIVDVDRLIIDYPVITLYPGKRVFRYEKPEEFTISQVQEAKATFSMVTFEITGRARYNIPPITPFSRMFFGEQGLEIKKDLYKAKRGPMRTVY